MPPGWEAELLTWSRATAPHEACGLLLGERRGSALLVRRATLARNLASRVDRFVVDPSDIVHALALAAAVDLALVGVWHSHVAAPAVPSATDCEAAWPELVQVIVGPVADEGCALSAYWIEGRRATPLRRTGAAIDLRPIAVSSLGKAAFTGDAARQR